MYLNRQVKKKNNLWFNLKVNSIYIENTTEILPLNIITPPVMVNTVWKYSSGANPDLRRTQDWRCMVMQESRAQLCAQSPSHLQRLGIRAEAAEKSPLNSIRCDQHNKIL